MAAPRRLLTASTMAQTVLTPRCSTRSELSRIILASASRIAFSMRSLFRWSFSEIAAFITFRLGKRGRPWVGTNS